MKRLDPLLGMLQNSLWLTDMKTFILTSDLPMFPIVTKQELSNYEIQIQAEQVSDGYHTMEELYEHRIALFAALCNFWNDVIEDMEISVYQKAWKSKLHSDGTMFEGGYFIAGIESNKGQITYHMKLKHWDSFRIPELERAPEYDGHTPNDVIERLLKL